MGMFTPCTLGSEKQTYPQVVNIHNVPISETIRLTSINEISLSNSFQLLLILIN